jgi:hypothetical protein
MNKIRAAITGIETYLPEYILTNQELTLIIHADSIHICESY